MTSDELITRLLGESASSDHFKSTRRLMSEAASALRAAEQDAERLAGVCRRMRKQWGNRFSESMTGYGAALAAHEARVKGGAP